MIKISTENEYRKFLTDHFHFNITGVPNGALVLGEMFKNIKYDRMNGLKLKLEFSNLKSVYRVILNDYLKLRTFNDHFYNQLSGPLNENNIHHFNNFVKQYSDGTHYYKEVVFGSVDLDVYYNLGSKFYTNVPLSGRSHKYSYEYSNLVGDYKYKKEIKYGRKASNIRFAGEEISPLEFFPIGGKLDLISNLFKDEDEDKKLAFKEYVNVRLDLYALEDMKSSLIFSDVTYVLGHI